MIKEVAVITVHGMGDTNPNYHKELEGKLRKYVGKNTWDNKIHLESVYYQDLLQRHQEDYWNEIDDEYDLKWDFLRKFILFSFSDAASIEHSLRNDMKLYLSVHQKIASAFDKSLEALGGELKPVIVIAHSLGCEQISNYIWDARSNNRYFLDDAGSPEEKAFRRLTTCTSLVTTGCNIPVFRAGLANPELFSRPNSGFKWDNYFDRDDVLAYPMRNLSSDFNVDWINDKKVAVGKLLTAWNPACHGQYWTDKDVLKPIANEIINILVK
ncbi:MAG: hypothetical protein HRT88_12845 [Lentisphaeraceae bacterium]|nr:hypothetical protein [Lentisphaeraceae bacterium]